jgi:acyl-CoA thioester hydrolase
MPVATTRMASKSSGEVAVNPGPVTAGGAARSGDAPGRGEPGARAPAAATGPLAAAEPVSAVYQVRVIFGDTDQLGVVYYANYLRYFDGARAALWRGLGHSQQQLDALGLAFPVIDAGCRYLRPARCEDLLDVAVRLTGLRYASVRLEYEVRRDGELLATGFTVQACTGRDGRSRRIPPELRASIGSPRRA